MPLWRSMKRCEGNGLSLPCAPRQYPGTNARQTVCRSRHLIFPGCSVLTSRFPRACAVHRPLTGNSRRSTSLPSSICSGSPSAFEHDFSEQPAFSSEPASRVGYAILDNFSAPAAAARHTANRKPQVQRVDPRSSGCNTNRVEALKVRSPSFLGLAIRQFPA